MKLAWAVPGAALAAVMALSSCASGGSSPAGNSGALPPASAFGPTNAPSAVPVNTSASPSPAHHTPARGTACGTGLWRHVYHPDRLRLVRQCMTVRGRVTGVRWEPDGDAHILLATRPALVNSGNVQYEHGDLVLEEICQGAVTQADAVAACRGVPHNLTVPSVGDKVTVTGSYVLDADHGWMEIHPVTSLAVTGFAPAASPPPPSSAPPPAPAGCYPKTPSGGCYEPGEFCPTADAGMTGVAGDGKTIVCRLVSGRYHWED